LVGEESAAEFGLYHPGVRETVATVLERKEEVVMLPVRACVLALALSLIVSLPAAGQSVPGSGAVTVIRAGTLIDGRSQAARRDQVIVVRGNRIESVGDAASTKSPEGANVIDLSRAT